MSKKTAPKGGIFDLFAYQRLLQKREARREWWCLNWDKVLMAFLSLLAITVSLIVAT